MTFDFTLVDPPFFSLFNVYKGKEKIPLTVHADIAKELDDLISKKDQLPEILELLKTMQSNGDRLVAMNARMLMEEIQNFSNGVSPSCYKSQPPGL